MNVFGDADVMSLTSYCPLEFEQAIEDGELVEIFKDWLPAGGKPIVATRRVFSEISLDGLEDIWNGYILWHKYILPTLPYYERVHETEMDGRRIWLMKNKLAYVILHPEDY